MPTADEVIVEFEARVGKYEADLKRATKTFENATNSQRDQMARLERQIASSSSAIGAQLRNLAGVFAGAFSASQIQQLADGYTRFTNQLKVAGLEGQNLGRTQQSLFDIAQKYGVELESLGSLYSRGSQVAKELGASQADLLKFTEGVSAALKVQGASAEDAQGALLQLAQLLASGTVRAEEFNSVNEGALPILQAVAKNIDAAGGSVGKLKALVNDGKISSQQFFRAFLAGSADLQTTAGQTTLTIGNAFTVLNNALGKFIGETDQSLSATQRISSAIITLSENLDVIVNALGVLSALLLGRYVAGAVAAARSTTVVSTAIFAMQARAAGAATTMEALGLASATAGRAMLAAFGGPVGIAITALTLGIGYLVERNYDAEQATDDLAASIHGQTAEFAKLREKQAQAAAESGNMSGKQRQLQTATASLTGEVGLLANAWARVAAEAKAAALEQARAAAMSAKSNYEIAKKRFEEKADAGFRAAPRPVAERGLGRDLLPNNPEAARAAALKGAAPEAQLMLEAAKNWETAAKELRKTQQQGLAEFKQAPAAAPAGKPKKDKKPKTPTGPTAEEIEARHQEALSRTNQEELQARIQLATDAADRAALMHELFAEEYKERVAQINADKHFTEEQKKAQIAALAALYGNVGQQGQTGPNGEITVSAPDRGLYGKQVEKELQDERNRLAQDMLEREQEALEAQADISTDTKTHREFAMRALEIQQKIETALLEQAIANGQIADADKARALLRAKQEADKKGAERGEAGPLAKWMQSVPETGGEINDALEGIATHGLDSFASGIADAIVNFKSLGDVAKSVLTQITQMLIELAIRMLVMKALKAIGIGISTGGSVAGKATGGKIEGYAGGGQTSGGLLRGRGTGLSDSIMTIGPRGPIMLSDGEFIVKASAAKKIGAQALTYMNQFGEVPAVTRAGGGPIAPFSPATMGASPNGMIPSRVNGFGVDGSFKSMIADSIRQATGAMPPINLYPTLDPAAVVRAAFATPGGRKAMFETVSKNSGAFRSSLDR
ncbi:tape measure protein [Sphingobium fuliginis]|uniref:Tape measure protein n=1 Tax=Sphingobium fuliginis ATCC 27551 TaxID=1208342 RepID=A0A5B8CE11_SPHSA|nr:tape measure protein [Sphingobium fuliginis]QDC37105.1 tape measure protein [Sphingobium fuliginis ATCC 27551]